MNHAAQHRPRPRAVEDEAYANGYGAGGRTFLFPRRDAGSPEREQSPEAGWSTAADTFRAPLLWAVRRDAAIVICSPTTCGRGPNKGRVFVPAAPGWLCNMRPAPTCLIQRLLVEAMPLAESATRR